jgi:hypothetical protein
MDGSNRAFTKPGARQGELDPSRQWRISHNVVLTHTAELSSAAHACLYANVSAQARPIFLAAARPLNMTSCTAAIDDYSVQARTALGNVDVALRAARARLEVS